MKKGEMTMLKILKLRIILIDSNPKIWREVLIPIDNTFEDLHYVIQAVMDWGNYHLHEFPMNEKEYIGDEPPNPQSRIDRSYTDERKVELEECLNQKGATIKYIYDFGDNWRHEIEVVDILKKENSRQYPVCIDGENASPPEDVGGVSGYNRMVEAFSDENHPDYERYKEWLGIEVYNAKRVNMDYINKKIKELVW